MSDHDRTGTPGALARRNLLEVFNERDPAARADAGHDLYAAAVAFHEPTGTVRGPEAVVARAGELLDEAPGFVFAVQRLRQDAASLAVLDWTFGPEGGDPVVSGTDVVLVADGRIRALHTVIDAG